MYPNLRLYLDLEEAATTFTKAALTAKYGTDDAAVAADQSVQNFASTLIDPKGGNVGRINPSNRLDTIDKLAALSAQTITLTLLHNLAQLNDFGVIIYNAAVFPFAPVGKHLFSPQKDYSIMVEMLAMLPNREGLARQYSFADAFEVLLYKGISLVPNLEGTPPFSDDTVPDWNGTLPFTGDGAEEANQAVIKFRYALTQYVSSTSYGRQMQFLNTPEEILWHLYYYLSVRIQADIIHAIDFCRGQ
ncbi:hypothetical protein CEUSTIGMA_g7764.t1 [Chlamydomonas eustigma]|uniref:Lipoxygenase domain-containing protein n=1 Tax=Chlamydomonas eustigma TaxID=1157962 RepID=A0A250XB93_9CHLO|nr:hypothetical protein CEUSTIGMA_g7764.t1 [Chlamydomonas eustigma]|eukprot:GAX80326.1 hypothetical protein CEUSTIGMA_g7764.t1 [Chlamydomonas eustigma]